MLSDLEEVHSDNSSLLAVVFGVIMFLGAITSRITLVSLSFATIIAAGIIYAIALIFLFFQIPIANRGKKMTE